ncbi:MAG: response regulator [Anaerolineae bacterium]|nr:response regulator [Anaerolineae bacterium]MCA9890172.1 response regulator [Anaerolineae bacterium]MCA9891708.1 response regulator [Anaerolineae bacterium]
MSDLPTGKIMIVDDDATNREVMEAFLTLEHFEVMVAANGRDALEQIRQEKPDLVLLDVRMPMMSGFDVCRTIKDQYNIPVFMLTGFDADEQRREAVEAGADAFISRPFDITTLMKRIRESIRR